MFALRASSSSTLAATARKPILSLLIRKAALSTEAPEPPTEDTPRQPSLGDFLGPALSPPTTGTLDGPPEPTRGYAKYGPPVKTEKAVQPTNTNSQHHMFGDVATATTALPPKPRYRLHCKASRNNTRVMFTDQDGTCIAWFSGGSCKFKGANRASYEAGYQCAVRAFAIIQQTNKVTPLNLELYLSGFGQGRDAMKTALLAAEGTEIRGMVKMIQDRTPIKIGGTRAPKARRL